MKTLFSILLVGLFSIEIMSPFMISYMNATQNHHKKNIVAHNNSTKKQSPVAVIKYHKKYIAEPIVSDENNYSDSKTLSIKENDLAFNERLDQ